MNKLVTHVDEYQLGPIKITGLELSCPAPEIYSPVKITVEESDKGLIINIPERGVLVLEQQLSDGKTLKFNIEISQWGFLGMVKENQG